MARWSDLPGTGSIRGRMAWLAALTAVGFALFTVVAFRALDRLRVNGPLYGQIVMGKDLVADILPPPAYIIEAYLTVHRLLDEPDPAVRQGLIERGRVLAADFESRQAFWLTQPLPDGLRRGLTESAAAPARAFFALRDTALVPAVHAGDHARALALSQGPLLALYEAHRRAIDEVVEEAGLRIAGQEAEAQALVATGRRRLLLTGVGLAGVLSALGLLLAGADTRPAGRPGEAPRRGAAGPAPGNRAGALRTGG
ncbi:MAG: hypothetical protein IPI38_05910 [Gemmatimonadetes bacterium]|jgi:hypothetical protein|nr:hypothetical protein [Gemmatimonadota bacterium]MBK7924932.1 hypothetical protein [Gemmatimonadota bacterium]MBK9067952.1 hypothetical protein [Gemmatimonadota bacterium]MBK9693026.1 hypothetical protein [Gemmatimonadota bacterium]